MKPIIILPPDVMSPEDINALQDNELCVVVASDPASVKFVDPIPAVTSRSQIESAAIQLSRRILNGIGFGNSDYIYRKEACALFVQILVEGTPLAETTEADIESQIFDDAKVEEICRLAREEAREERAAKKALKTKKPE